MYSQTTLGALVDQIATTLQDPSHTYWTVDEISRAVKEGLRLWGGFTSYWRERGEFSTSPGVPFYDLASKLPDLRSRTVTGEDLIIEMQYSLLESPTGSAWTGQTGMFTLAQFTQAIARGRNQFALDARLPYQAGLTTGITWDQASMTWDDLTLTWDQLADAGSGAVPAMPPPPNGRVQLSDQVALIARLAWRTISGVYTPLRREDPWTAMGFSPTWNLSPGVPVAFSQTETMPLEIQLYPEPLDQGSLDILWVPSIPVTNMALPLGIPDEFASAVKYHALYEILASDGPGQDTFRSKYALERYKMIVQAAQLMRSILALTVNGVPCRLDTLAALDSGDPTWETLQGTSTISGVAFDTLGLAKVPGAILGISADVVRSAPIPAGLGSYIQLGREELAYLIGYVTHALSFKLGGGEFQESFAGHDDFLAGAGQRSKLLSQRTKMLGPVFAQPAKEEGVSHAA